MDSCTFNPMNTTLPTFPALAKMFHDGILSTLIATTFDGQSGYQLKMRDAETSISFPNMEKTPNAEGIRELVEKHYTQLGYIVSPFCAKEGKPPYFTVASSETLAFISITISAPRPNEKGGVDIQVNCEIVAE